tara:strand:- start:1138 stop:1329 length:192 start_codon:yes stop_codon:yes gene_type:complete
MNPDIEMCKGTNCPLKESCHRYTAKPNDNQSWFVEPPFEDNKCDMYWGENQEYIWKQLKDITK